VARKRGPADDAFQQICRAWVAVLYADVLGRSPSRREVAIRVETLERNGGSREQTALEFLRGARRELAERQP
jgi:hypothetical protein